MLDQMIIQNEHKAIEAELVKASFQNAHVLNFAGALVFSLLVYAVHKAAPWWTWAPALICLYLVTLFRVLEIRRYLRTPEFRNSSEWVFIQTVYSALAGICWGAAAVAMLMCLPTILQLFVLTVTTVVAAATASEDILLVQPPRAFILACIGPPTIWLLTTTSAMHVVLAIMLLAFISLAFALGNKKSRLYAEAQHLRFQNEFLAKELSRQHSLLERASNAKTRFLAAASHDLRQPVAALMIFLEQLATEQQLSRKGMEVLDHAQQATTSLRTLLDGLLDISRLDGQAIRTKVCSFVIQNLFNELNEEFLPLAEQKGIRLKFAACSAVIESDRILTGQILRNLVSNAIRYTPSGRILVGCRHRQGMLAIEVHDTGIGIAEDQCSRIFDEFYQVDNSEREQKQGLGLGLSIVDRAARLLGHTITLTSRLGKGSSFVLTVPLVKRGIAENHADQMPSSKASALAGKNQIPDSKGFTDVQTECNE